MPAEFGQTNKAVFAIQSPDGLIELEPGGVYWTPVASAEEGEKILEKIDGASTPPPGRFFYRGSDLARFSRKDWLAYLARTAFLTPSGDLMGNLPVVENLLVSTFPDGRTGRGELIEKIEAEVKNGRFLGSQGPESFLRSLPYRLQLIDRARAAALRAVLRDAEWIVRTDEPPGIESESREEYHRLLIALRERLPHAPWLFVCVQSELPDAFKPVTTLPITFQ